MSPDTMIYVKIGGKKYTLPVNPEDIEVSHPHVDKTAEIAGLGEILIPQKQSSLWMCFIDSGRLPEHTHCRNWLNQYSIEHRQMPYMRL